MSSVSVSQGAVGWSAVCNCVISLSYSLTFLFTSRNKNVTNTADLFEIISIFVLQHLCLNEWNTFGNLDYFPLTTDNQESTIYDLMLISNGVRPNPRLNAIGISVTRNKKFVGYLPNMNVVVNFVMLTL